MTGVTSKDFVGAPQPGAAPYPVQSQSGYNTPGGYGQPAAQPQYVQQQPQQAQIVQQAQPQYVQAGYAAQPAAAGYTTAAYNSTQPMPLDVGDGVMDVNFYNAHMVPQQAAAPQQQMYSQQLVSYAPQHTSAAAAALDAADGVMDGQHFGRPIVSAGSPRVVQQQIYSAPAIGGGPVQYSQGQTAADRALALDAADGVIDGNYFGRPIVQTSGAMHATSSAPSLAQQLDAADGVIDGKHFGRQIVQAAPAQQMYATSSAPTLAQQLDAADGVMDGKHFGQQIVQVAQQPVSPADHWGQQTGYTGQQYGVVPAPPARRYSAHTTSPLHSAQVAVPAGYQQQPAQQVVQAPQQQYVQVAQQPQQQYAVAQAQPQQQQYVHVPQQQVAHQQQQVAHQQQQVAHQQPQQPSYGAQPQYTPQYAQPVQANYPPPPADQKKPGFFSKIFGKKQQHGHVPVRRQSYGGQPTQHQPQAF